MKKITLLLNLLAVLIGLSAGVYPANAAFRTVGPPSAVHGFPLWYQDVTGLSLQPCLDQTTLSPAGGLLCILPGPIAADPTAIPPVAADPGFDPTLDPTAHTITTTPGATLSATNFPDESFYWIADVTADIPVTGGFTNGVPDPTPVTFKLRLALEAAFQNGPPVNGDQFTFLRINLQKIAGGLVPGGLYTVSIPFGANITFTANADGSSGSVGGTFAGQTFRNQVDALPPLFDAILPGIFPATIPPVQAAPFTLDNFLVWDPAVLPAAPAGFIGDPNVLHPVVKAGDTAQAVVTFSGPGLAAPVTLNQFNLAGKIIGLVITPPAGGTAFGVSKLAPVATTKTFTVSNLSPNIVNVVVATSNVTDFAILNNTCGQLLPGTPPATCTFDVAFSPTADGLKTTTITVSDQAAAVPATTINLTGTGDGILPVVVIADPANNGFTSDNTPLLTFTATDANPVTNVVRVDGVIVAKVSGDSLAQLADGAHIVLVESTDAAGNLGSATSSFTVDTLAPVVAITAPAAGLTNDNTPLLSFSVTEINAVTNVVKVDGVIVAKVSGDSLAQLADGPHTIRVESTDAAGNIAVPVEVIITVDATPPLVSLTAPANNGFTNDNTPLLTFTATDVNPVTNVVRVDGVIVAKVSGDSLAQLADGAHIVLVESTDAAGNLGSATSSFTVDTLAPVVAITAPAAGLTNDNTPLLSFSVTEINAVTNVVKVDGVIVAKVSGDSLAQLADGPHTIRVESTDAAGNIAVPVEVTITVDTTPPVVAITAPANNGFTNDNTPLLTFAVTDTNTVTNVVKVDNVVVTKVSGDSLAQLADGSHTVTVVTTDAAGNISSTTVTFTVDTVLPVVGITTPTAGLTKISTLLLTFAATDTNAVTNVVKVDGVIVAKVSGDSLALLADGPHTIRVESTDAAGNIAVPVEVVVTVDTVVSPFTLNAVATPTRIATQTIGGTIEAGATVVVTTNTAATASAVVFSGTGATLNWSSIITGLVEGVNSITVTATDPAGNQASQQSGIRIVLPDGKITGAAAVSITDALKALQFATGLIQPTPEEALHADVAPLVNGIPSPNGKVDIGDVVLVLRKFVNPTSW
jgi:Big-like domain-containing protein